MGGIATPGSVRIEHQRNPIGFGTSRPRLSWQVPSAPEGYVQQAYEIEWLPAGGHGERRVVESSEQVLVPWPFEPLPSRARGDVRVRVYGGGLESQFSDPATLEVGLLDESDWQASFISPAQGGGKDDPAPILEKRITIDQEVTTARLYATAQGVYEATLNDQRIGNEILAPGWTSYHHRLRYQTYDITNLLTEGDNRLRVTLGNGWWRGRIGWESEVGFYGDSLAFLGQIEVTYADGSRQVIGTDETWLVGESGIIADDLYDGQTTDLRVVNPVCERPVRIVDADLLTLVAPEGPPVRITEEVAAVSVFRSSSGKLLVDFGQNLVGWVRLRVRNASAGQEITVRHAEVLEHGELGTRPLRSAKATDRYILTDAEDVSLEPSLTFHGFRYAEIDGVDEINPADATAIVIGSDLDRSGAFECSHDGLNQLHKNVVWGMRGNFVDVPTDCPQRDERMGWTGDIQVFAEAATYLHDCAGFLTSWLQDLAAEQDEAGNVPFVVPNVLPADGQCAAAWSDAATIVPWVLYQRYGDTGVLRQQYPSMTAWADRVWELSGDDHLWTGSSQFGDWLDPSAPPDDPARAKVAADMVASVYAARSNDIVGHTAALFGDETAAEVYRDRAESIGAAILERWTDGEGRLREESQTGYAMLIAFHILDNEAHIRTAGEQLATLVADGGYRIGTGFVGTPIILHALRTSGQIETAIRLLLQTECPSWLYPVTMGATTVWERWDSMLPDGSINPGEMTSFNHYALGAVADWMHRSLAGLAPAAPGYRRMRVAPLVFNEIEWADTTHETPYGPAAAGWKRAADGIEVHITVPVGVIADVQLPDDHPEFEVGHGEHRWVIANERVRGEAGSI